MGAIAKFGTFELDLRTRELRNRGIRLRLRQQSAEILVMLIERPGEVVTREEIRTKLWPDGTIVEFEHSVSSAVNRLRQVLGDSPGRSRYVETLPRLGYRFVGLVEMAGPPAADSSPPPAAPQEPQTPGPPTLRRQRWTMVAELAIIASVAGAVSWHLIGHRSGAFPAIHSIAVLPLVNLSQDAGQEYSADALTEELIVNLAQIKAWHVLSRTSVMRYRNSGKPLRQIASELGVQAIVEGSFQRLGDVLCITAKLIDAQTDRTLWARSYQLDIRNSFALRDELVRKMAADLRAGFPPAEQGRLSKSRHVEPTAYDAYLRGRFYQFKETEEDARTAIRSFEHALEIDPGYAPAYAALAHVHNTTAQITGMSSRLQETRRLAQRALEIDPGVAEAHVMIGVVRTFYDWDFTGAESELRNALEINPSCAEAFVYYGALLGALGRHDEAIAMAKEAVDIDPLVPTWRPAVGFRFYFARRYDEAAEQFRQALRQTPGSWVAHLGLGSVYRAQGQQENAVDELKKAVELSGGAEEARAALACAYARAGRRREALDMAGADGPAGGSKFLSSMSLADLCVSLGEKDLAFVWLTEAYEQRQFRLVFLKVDPAYDSLRSDPRFQNLLRRIGLSP